MNIQPGSLINLHAVPDGQFQISIMRQAQQIQRQQVETLVQENIAPPSRTQGRAFEGVA